MHKRNAEDGFDGRVVIVAGNQAVGKAEYGIDEFLAGNGLSRPQGKGEHGSLLLGAQFERNAPGVFVNGEFIHPDAGLGDGGAGARPELEILLGIAVGVAHGTLDLLGWKRGIGYQPGEAFAVFQQFFLGFFGTCKQFPPGWLGGAAVEVQ